MAHRPCKCRLAWLLVVITAPLATAGGIFRDPTAVKPSYDYVIAGGGLTGLVVANRLTEDPNTTVLVVEYGDIDDTWNTAIPYYANNLQDASLMFQVLSVPQRGLANRTASLPLGATLGGGTTVNGMAVTRGSRGDYDAWEELGNKGWGWDGLVPYFRKSSTLNSPGAEALKYNYTFSNKSYGNGQWQCSWPTFQWPDVYAMNDAWTKDLGLHMRSDGGTDGDNLGLTWKPIDADPKNFTRSSARKAYYDPASKRANFDLLLQSYVSKVHINNLTATGFEIMARNTSAKVSVNANREVILAAGAVHTPQILQLSGIGSAALLKTLNVSVLLDLPGVGANFQDHPRNGMTFQFNNPNPINIALYNNSTWMNNSFAEFFANRTGPLTMAHGNTRMILSLPNLTATGMPDATALSLLNSPPDAYAPASYHDQPTLLAGYRAQAAIQAHLIGTESRGFFEFTFAGDARVGIVLDKPLSRGTIAAISPDPHPGRAPPQLDWGSLNHPFDARAHLLGLQTARRLMSAPSLDGLQPVELTPGAGAQSDAEIEAALRGGLVAPHNAHPCCSAAMMPRELGGVVDARLRVWGVERLRVVDASVLPLLPTAHLQATMFAVAEKAADIIKGVEA